MIKRFIQLVSTSLVGASLMMGVAGATASSCPTGTIEKTGQGSTNTITCTTTADTHVTCINDVYVVGINGQAAQSGNGSSSGNTSGGVVVTGNATNDNNQTVTVGASCGAAVATTSTTPPAGGQGSGEVAAAPAAAAPAAQPVQALPKTGNNAALADSLIGAAVLVGTAAVAQLGLSAYRRAALK